MKPPCHAGPARRPAGGGAPDPDDRPWAPSRGYLLLALGAIVAAPLLWFWAAPAADPMPEQPAPAPRPVAAAQAPAPITVPAATPLQPVAARTPAPASAPAMRVREPGDDPTPDLADVLNPGETPTMADVIARLHANGVHSGLGAFQPPGTRPPLIGLAVPEDFVLPPGYVRHHQATDDGQRIEAILMFSPDVPWVDAQGRPVTLPADRVVPLELAPPGLPIRRIVVPAPIHPRR